MLHVNKTIFKCGFQLVRPALNCPYILFEFLPIGGEKWVVVRFAEMRAWEGLVCIAEVRVTMVQCFSSASATVDTLIEFR
jgi:hypothetical protein